MDFNISSVLEQDETVLWSGMAHVEKTSNQFLRFLLMLVVLFVFWFLFIIGVNQEKIVDFGLIIFFLILLLLTVFLIYGLIYNMSLKHRNKDNKYWITDKRVILLNVKNGIKKEYISNIEYLGIAREKNGYGDIIFSSYGNNLMEQIKSGFSFEGVENPRGVVRLIIERNSKISIYDDKTTFLGKKL